MARENSKSQGPSALEKTQQVLRQQSLSVLRLLQSTGSLTTQQIVEEAESRARDRTTSGLKFLRHCGLVEEGSDGVLVITDLGRVELGLPPLERNRLKIPDTSEDFKRLVLQVLATKRNETNYCFERLVGDLRLLAERFGFTVSTLASTFLENEVRRAVQLLAGRKVLGRSDLIPSSPPRIRISRAGGEHIEFLY
jgi:hypothetical protein